MTGTQLPDTIPRSIRWRIHLGLLQYNNDDSNQIGSHQFDNPSLIALQRQRYDSLLLKHYKQSSAIDIIHDSEQHSHTSQAKIYSSQSGMSHHTTLPKGTNALSNSNGNHIEDPLSVFAQIEEIKIKSEKQKELEIKKERALASRSQHSTIQHNYDVKGKATNDQLQKGQKQKDGKVGQRWSEFYSSREIMDIIEKDVDRLPVDHQVAAFFIKMNQIQKQESDFELESQLKYMNQKEETSVSDDEVMKQCRQERSIVISQILFVYAKEYQIMGYRQGMHEILSLVYLCLEIDLIQKRNNKEMMYSALLDPSKIANDAYTVFEAIMALLSPAFESSSMEVIGTSTLDKIRIMARDEELFHFISSLSIPPELYCTRWIRLMFSREVKGLHHVMILWDSFFRLVSSISKNEDVDKPNDSSTNSLMNILETAAAAMILMLKVDLIRPHAQKHKIYDDDRDPNDCIHLLMNYPPIENASNLVKIIEEMIYGKFNLDVDSSSTQITMSDEMKSKSNNDSNDYSHTVLNTDGYASNSSAMTHNTQMMYGYNEINQMMYHTQYSNPTKQENNNVFGGQVYSQNQINYKNIYTPKQSNSDAIRSTIENITRKDTWKKISGGMSEGLHAFKGALGSLDQKINNLYVGNENTSYSSFASGGQFSHHQTRNIYIPSNRHSSTMLTKGNEQHEGHGAQIDSGNKFEIQDSIYNSGYRIHSQSLGENIGLSQISHQVSNEIVQPNILNNQFSLSHTQTFEADSADQPEVGVNDNVVETMEDDFVGGGNSKSYRNNDCHQIVRKLDSSLLTISNYLQTMNETSKENTIPQSVWDAITELEAMKVDLATNYNIHRKEK